MSCLDGGNCYVEAEANLDKEEGCLSLDAGFLAKTSAGISNNNGDHK